VLAGFEHDGVAVLFAVGECEEDGEDGGGKRDGWGWRVWRVGRQ
jgi:hypothetical protein